VVRLNSKLAKYVASEIQVDRKALERAANVVMKTIKDAG
jgi:hypothetical protein